MIIETVSHNECSIDYLAANVCNRDNNIVMFVVVDEVC